MENPLINSLDFNLNHHSSPLSNGNIDQIQTDDIEMFAFQSKSYTSLKDLMPPSPPSTASPTSGRKDSWREIPIKDPLLQHAAWAYLQPMEAERDDDRRWWVVLLEKCGGMFGCLNDVVLVLFNWFPEQGNDREEDKVD